MIAVWESDMLDTFFKSRLNWSTDPTFFLKATGEVIPKCGPAKGEASL